MQVALSGPDKLRLRPRSQARQDLPPMHIPLFRAPLHESEPLSMHTFCKHWNMSSTVHHPTRAMYDLPVSLRVRPATLLI